MRVGEVVKLRPQDIDSKRKLIHIKGSKGRKDRYTLLSDYALKVLKEYLREYKPSKWLFEGARKGSHISTRTVQAIFRQACDKASIRYIQELLGHKSSKTTEIYTHVSKRNPLDSIMKEEIT
ncbi:MAG: tyrosine-type recombinase/integrase [Aquificota bacterium]|nr:tyrosine-type recombinase/integrase [Aquificota bacterium]